MASNALRAPAAASILLLAAGALLGVSTLLAARSHDMSGGGVDGCRVTSPCVYYSPPPPDPFLVPANTVIAEPSLRPAAPQPAPQRPAEAFVPVPQRPPIFV